MSDLTCEEIFGTVLPEKLAGNEKARATDAIYQFVLDGDNGGNWVVDLTKDEDQVSAGDHDEPNCTITMKADDFVELWTGKLAAPQAYMFGKLKIKGDMGLAMKLQNFIG